MILISISTALQLLNMGYTPDQIKSLETPAGDPDQGASQASTPDPEPQPEPQPTPDPAPAAAPTAGPETDEVKNMISSLAQSVNKLTAQMQQLAIRDVNTPTIPKASAEDILSQMLLPKNKKGEKE